MKNPQNKVYIWPNTQIYWCKDWEVYEKWEEVELKDELDDEWTITFLNYIDFSESKPYIDEEFGTFEQIRKKVDRITIWEDTYELTKDQKEAIEKILAGKN